MPMVHLVVILIALSPAPTAGQSAGKSVVIYLHGRIIEDQGPKAISPEFGAYDYLGVLDSLRAGGFQVLSEVRSPGTDVAGYARRVVHQVDSLLHAGLPASRIAVIGFSKGGGIAIRASAQLGRPDITFVFLAACGPDDPPDLRAAGRLLSVFEASDPLGQSCRGLFARALPGTTHDEHRINTGLRHGAFYRPRPDWLEPVRAWVRAAKPSGGSGDRPPGRNSAPDMSLPSSPRGQEAGF